MNKIVCIVLFFTLLSFTSNAQKRKIILKLDDVIVKNGNSNGLPTLNYIKDKKIKASFGLVASRNDASTLSVFDDFLNAKNEDGERLIEIWNHGYDHINPEFDGTDYAYQKQHFNDADQILNNLLRIKMSTFGAPFNHTDETTNLVISENSNYKLVFFTYPAPDSNLGIINLKNRVNIENGTGNPEFDFFVSNYNNYKDNYSDYMVLQGHPNVWNENHLNEFKKIIDFLIAENCEFILPFDYYLALHPNISQPTVHQEINFPSISTKNINDLDFDPLATATSQLPVLYNSSNLEVATIINNKIHIVGTGTSFITASQQGNETYKPADYKTQILEVSDVNLGLNTNNKTTIEYYPNPVQKYLTINYPKTPILSVKICNVLGQQVYESEVNNSFIHLNVSNLANSVYIFKIESSKGLKQFKIIKK